MRQSKISLADLAPKQRPTEFVASFAKTALNLECDVFVLLVKLEGIVSPPWAGLFLLAIRYVDNTLFEEHRSS
jgi:hypothetical protein